jgi:hypothetical protein
VVKITYLPLDRLDTMFAETPTRPLPRLHAKSRPSSGRARQKEISDDEIFAGATRRARKTLIFLIVNEADRRQRGALARTG